MISWNLFGLGFGFEEKAIGSASADASSSAVAGNCKLRLGIFTLRDRAMTIMHESAVAILRFATMSALDIAGMARLEC